MKWIPDGDLISRSLYKSVKNKLFTNVDLPSPDSPATSKVNSKPRFKNFLWTWSGRVEKPISSFNKWINKANFLILKKSKVNSLILKIYANRKRERKRDTYIFILSTSSTYSSYWHLILLIILLLSYHFRNTLSNKYIKKKRKSLPNFPILKQRTFFIKNFIVSLFYFSINKIT